ncbi:MAG TPA: ABC transporter permease [Candidatus Limnocylindria bacterium]
MRPARSLWRDAWFQFRRHRIAMAGLIVLTILVAGTMLGPFIYTTPINIIDFGASLEGPSAAHPFGTDDLGRDLLARALWGGRVSIAVGLTAVLLAITLGTGIGAIAGYFGKLDSPLMRLTDLFLSLPVLPLLLVIIFLFRDPLRQALGPEVGIFFMIVVVIGILNWMPVARLVRAQFLSLKQKEFVEAARAVGNPDGRIIWKHILPNVLSPVLVAATIGVGGAILTESTLSFLGLGFPPDVPTWGRLLFDAQNYIEIAPHWVFFPGFLIFLTVLSINYIGDGLRDALDPRKTA